MIHLVHGETPFFSHQELKRLTAGTEVVTIQGDQLDPTLWKGWLAEISLFQTPQSIVVKNFFALKNRSALEKKILETIGLSESKTIIFFENQKISPQGDLLDWIFKNGTIKYSPKLSKVQIGDWVKKQFSDQGLKIENEAAILLAEGYGDDLFGLENEITKISFWIKSQENPSAVRYQDVVQMVSASAEINVFEFSDFLGERRPGQALGALHQLLSNGGAPSYILVMIARQLKLLIKLKLLFAQGKSLSEVQKNLRLPPFVVKKLSVQEKNFTLNRLTGLFQEVVSVDWKIKRGLLDPDLGLDLLVQKIVSKESN